MAIGGMEAAARDRGATCSAQFESMPKDNDRHPISLKHTGGVGEKRERNFVGVFFLSDRQMTFDVWIGRLGLGENIGA